MAAPDLRSLAGFEIGSGPIDPPLKQVNLPARRHAVLRFKGLYSGLPAADERLYRNWLPGPGETPADSPVFEVYLNTPMDTPPEALLTEICLPLAYHQGPKTAQPRGLPRGVHPPKDAA